MKWLKIILWEKEPTIRLHIQATLEDAGHKVWPVCSPEAALRLCREEAPDLAILNVYSPQPADGLALARLLSSFAALQVCFITGAYATEAAIGGFPTLRKPFTQRQLQQFLLMECSRTDLIC